MAEWSIAAVLKTAVPQGTVGSNPTLSAIHRFERRATRGDVGVHGVPAQHNPGSFQPDPNTF